jgi:hypothetical protein
MQPLVLLRFGAHGKLFVNHLNADVLEAISLWLGSLSAYARKETQKGG